MDLVRMDSPAGRFVRHRSVGYWLRRSYVSFHGLGATQRPRKRIEGRKACWLQVQGFQVIRLIS
jgi:hypothetical protein